MTRSVDTVGAIRRTFAFAVALAALLYFAGSGTSSLAVYVLLTVFVAVATIWLRGQYADSLDGEQWVIPWWFGYLLLGIAGVLVILYYAFDQGASGLIGLIVAYFVAGSAMAEVRQSESVHLLRVSFTRMYFKFTPTMRWGIGITVAGVVVAFGGAALLGPAGQITLGRLLIVVGVLVLLPVGMGIWSEQLIRWLCARRDTTWLWSLFGAGAVVFVGAVAVAVTFSNSRWLIVPMVALGLLIVALVSTTMTDIVVVMAVVALMGVTPLQASEHGDLDPRGRGDVLVALGDSYMSGEGAAIYYEGTDEGGGNQCRRSPTAWAALAAQNELGFDGLAFLACSGARTANVLPRRPTTIDANATAARTDMPAPRPQPGEGLTQLDAYAGMRSTFTPRVVVLSIGGNDAGFSTIGTMCLAPGNCSSESALWNDSLEQVRRQLRATYLEVNAAFTDVPVVVVPYPDPISIRESGCTQVALARPEQRFIHDFLTDGLNRVIRETAQEYRFHYLGEMQDALARSHLQLCDPRNDGRPGINFIGLRSVRGIAEQRFHPANWTHSSLHPNERGHAAMLRVFQTWWATQKDTIEPRTGAPLTPQTVPAALTDEGERAGAPPCDLFVNTSNGCRLRGKEWANEQIGWTLLRHGPYVLLAVAGAWCIAVAMFAGRRRRTARRSDGARSGETTMTHLRSDHR